MFYFYCKFLLDTGQKVNKIFAAEDHLVLMEKISTQDGILIKTSKIPARAFRMSTQDAIFFFTYLREFLNADIPLVEAIETIVDETRKVNIKAISSKLQHDITHGYLLSDAMRNQNNVFSDISISLIAVSEKINALSGACNHIVNYLAFGAMIARKVRTVVSYPIAMFIIIFSMVVFYSRFVIPKLEGVFKEFGDGVQMPIQTKWLVAFSSFISNYWMLVCGLIILIPISIVICYRKSHTFKIYFDSFLLKVPMISSFVIKSQFARFSLFTANMYERGYNFLDAISEAIVVVTNEKIKIDLENMVDEIKTGDAVYKALRHIPYTPRFVHRMFRVAEVTSNVVRPLNTIYEFYAQEIQNDLEKMLQLVKPVALIVIGGLMFWILSATLLPFYTKLPALLQGAGV